MFSSEDDNQGVVWGLLFGVVVIVLGFVIGIGIHQHNKSVAKAVAVLMAAKATPVAVVADGASVKVENGVVKFYFASGKHDLAAGGNDALVEVVKAAASGKKLLISGFHDSTGDLAKNEELAKLRAFGVRDALKALGVAEDKMELKKPEVMMGSGSNADARRVEVSEI
jgi:outer membrane protein OmpA-like peptidoglycan-associated protein